MSESGDNQIVIVAGANNKLSIEDLEEAKHTIATAAVLVLQLETAEEVAAKALQLCKGVSKKYMIIKIFFKQFFLGINIKWCSCTSKC